MQGAQALTLPLAIYGALLSTIKVLADWSESRRRIEFAIKRGGVGSELGFEPVVFLRVSNPGHREVTLDELGIELPENRELMYRHPKGEIGELPVGVGGWKSASAWIALSEIRTMLGRNYQEQTVQIRAKARDALGRVHLGPPVSVDLYPTS